MVPEEEAAWRFDSPAWSIPDFFDMLKHHFRPLNFVPIGQFMVTDMCTPSLGEGLVRPAQEIYRNNGWPPAAGGNNTPFPKERCLSEVRHMAKATLSDCCARRDEV